MLNTKLPASYSPFILGRWYNTRGREHRSDAAMRGYNFSENALGSRFGPIRSAQGILLGAAMTTVPWACWASKPWTITSFHPALSAVIALITLGIFCGGLVYTLFIILINRVGPNFASTSNYLVPPTGAFLGIAFSGEKLISPLLYSLVLILFSLWLSSGKKSAEN
ncbi:MAG: DMT family transporter [Verrucomicrobiota bacterium]